MATPRKRPRYAKLPEVPVNASPVPELTSLYHKDAPGPYGDRRYPGNCSGELIKDLLRYYRPRNVLDPMTGSRTCADVCAELGISCQATDLKDGADACAPAAFPAGTFDFIWVHPPYWRQKVYSNDPRDLSAAPNLDAFLDQYHRLIGNCANALALGGKLAILMGDYTDRERGFVPLVYYTKRLAFACGLTQPCTDIVRFSHAASSSKKVYRSAFIPGLHDVCVILEKPRQEAKDCDASPTPGRPAPAAAKPALAGSDASGPTPPAARHEHPPFVLRTLDSGGSKMRLARSNHFRQMQITFDAMPPPEIACRLRDAGWTWRPAENRWTRQLDRNARWRGHAEAERLFEELAERIDARSDREPAR